MCSNKFLLCVITKLILPSCLLWLIISLTNLSPLVSRPVSISSSIAMRGSIDCKFTSSALFLSPPLPPTLTCLLGQSLGKFTCLINSLKLFS